jgi:uncharacterized protein YjbK
MESAAREIEFKFAVHGKQAFDHLVNYLDLPLSVLENGVIQINHFFDSPAYCLHKRHFVIRLREENGSYTLTIKGEQQAGPGASNVLTDRVEEEVELAPATARALLDGEMSPQQVINEHFSSRAAALLALIETACNQQQLVNIGDFRNVRIHLPPLLVAVGNHDERLQFELDSSTFPDGRVDCEIEIEISEQSDAAAIEAALKDLFRQANIQWHAAPSKAERFFAALTKAG